jgi:predicted solute-binding protein
MDSESSRNVRRRIVVAADEEEETEQSRSALDNEDEVISNPDEAINEDISDADEAEGEDLAENWLEYVTNYLLPQ